MNAKDAKILDGMLEFAHRVIKRTADLTHKGFINDIDVQDSILYALGQLGKKAKTLSDKFMEKYPSEE